MKIEDALVHITLWAAVYQDTSEDPETAQEEFVEVFEALVKFLPTETLKLFYQKIDKLEHLLTKTLDAA